MPNRNLQGSPKLIYRVDSRPPQEVFEHGFTPWGQNPDFFEHVLGYSLGDDIPQERRSGLISASDSPDSSVRFFGGLMVNPFDRLEYYLYEIRADETVYSAQRTASFYQQRIHTGQVEFVQGDMDTAIDAVDAIMGDFAYQREWFSVGPIPRERVRSAWRMDAVSINPDHIRHQPDTVYFTPRINEPEIMNPNYVDANTFANDLPYTQGATLQTTSRLSLPTELAEADASGGVGASLGFACSPESSPRSKRGAGGQTRMVCYFDRQLVKKPLKTHRRKTPFILSEVFGSKVHLVGSATGTFHLLVRSRDKNQNVAALAGEAQIARAPDFIYDTHFNLALRPDDAPYGLSLIPVYVGSNVQYDLAYEIATVNNPSQKWRFAKVPGFGHADCFRIQNQLLLDFSVQREIATNRVVLKPFARIEPGYEELYLVLDKTRGDSCILLPQKPIAQLIDLQLSWFYKNQNYVPVPESGYSAAGKPRPHAFFYDLDSYKIVYVDRAGRIFALYNNIQHHNWNWVRWVRSDLELTYDTNLMWYFQNQRWDPRLDYNGRNILSFNGSDYLRVVLSGANWGALYTTTRIADTNSIAIFRIDPSVDL